MNPSNLPPSFRVTEMMLSLWVPQAIHAAAALGLADVLARGPRRGEDLAVDLDVDPEALRRLLRGLVLLELCTETEDGAYRLLPWASAFAPTVRIRCAPGRS